MTLSPVDQTSPSNSPWFLQEVSSMRSSRDSSAGSRVDLFDKLDRAYFCALGPARIALATAFRI
jgi:hypothetical protein